MKRLFFSLVFLGLIAGGAWLIYAKYYPSAPVNNFRTATVKRGDLSITILATGTLEPEEVVDVGAQVVGPILKLGDDPRGKTDPAFKGKSIDYGSPVEDGTVLAQIDPAVYEANLSQAKATLQRGQADLGELKAHRDQALAEWNRAQKLRSMSLNNITAPTGDKLGTGMMPIKAISDSDYDLAKANYDVAQANLDVGQATVTQDEAVLKLSNINLGYTTIKSPVKGTIIDRRVNVGQTVVSSFNAPSLFLIAKDLRQMQVWASVNEADIGRLQVGMPVRFTVDAYPNDVFHGSILQIRYNAQMTQNVVTYTVVVQTDNSEMKLLPYLTANVNFEVDKRTDVLLVPNAALRWEPKPQEILPAAREALEARASADEDEQVKTESSNEPSPKSTEKTKADKSTTPTSANPAGAASSGQSASATDQGQTAKAHEHTEHKEHGTLWVRDGDYVRPIEVRVGQTDSTLTEVSGADLADGMDVVIGEVRDRVAADATTNPFAPQFFRGRRGQKSQEGGAKGQKGG